MAIGEMQKLPGMSDHRHSETVRPAVELELQRLRDVYAGLARIARIGIHADNERTLGRYGINNLPPPETTGKTAPEILEQIIALR